MIFDYLSYLVDSSFTINTMVKKLDLIIMFNNHINVFT